MNIPLKLLLLEDDPFDAELNITMLEAEGYACEWKRVQTKKEFLTALKTPNYDIILVDYNLPAFDGMSALHLLKEQDFDIPVLFVTGNLQAELAIDSIKTGATDFVHKDRLTRLAPSVTRALEEASLRRASKEKEATLALFKELNQIANQGATLNELALFLAKQLPSILACVNASVHLQDDERKHLLVYTPLEKHKKVEKKFNISMPKLILPLDSDTIYATTASGKEERILLGKEEILKLLEEYVDAAPFSEKNKKRLNSLLPTLLPTIQLEKIHLFPILSGESTIGLLELAYQEKHQSSNPEKVASVLEQISAIFSRKLAEVELAQLHHRNKLILDSAAEGILGLNMEGGHIFVNPVAAKMLGYEVNELLQGEKHQLYHPDFENNLPGENNNCPFYHKLDTSDEKRSIFYRKDGSSFPISYTNSLIIENEKTIGVVVAFRDITKQVETRREIARLAQVVEQASSSIAITDLAGNFIYINPCFEKISGYQESELLGNNPRVLKSEYQDNAFYDDLWKTITKGEVWQKTLINKRKDGTFYHEDANIFPIKSADGKTINYATVKRDITAEVQAQEETKRTRDELARLYRASGALLASASPSLETLGQRIVETVLFEFKHSNCSLILANDDSLLLERVAVAGTYAKEVSQSTLLINGKGLVPEVIRKGIVINSSNVNLRKNYTPNWEAARSEMAVPLSVGEKTIGAIDVQSPEKNAFSADDQRLLVAFAERAALSIENVRLFEDAKLRLNRLGALHTIDVAIAKSVDNNQTVEVIAEQAQKQLKVDAISILVKNQSTQSFQCLARQGFNTKALVYTNLALGEGLAGKAASKRQIIRIDNLAEEKPFAKTSELADENFISYWGVPLVSKGEVNGVLEIFHRSPLMPNAEWESFLNTLAGQAAIAIDNASLFNDLQKSNRDLRLSYDATLEGWARALELRDMETEGHSRRVTKLTTKLATAMGIEGEELEHIRRGALLHDVGKMGIPDSILHKPGPLNDDEWAIMKQHTVYAYDMLKSIPFLLPALGIPRSHHEKWDGSGYPEGLSGEAIPLGARIFAIIDVYDALTSERPYRKEACSQEKTLAHIKEGKGTHFDPRVVEAFIKLIMEKDQGE